MFLVRRHQAGGGSGSPLDDDHCVGPQTVVVSSPGGVIVTHSSSGTGSTDSFVVGGGSGTQTSLLPRRKPNRRRTKTRTSAVAVLCVVVVWMTGLLVGLGIIFRGRVRVGRTLTSALLHETTNRDAAAAATTVSRAKSRGRDTKLSTSLNPYKYSGLSPLTSSDYQHFTVRINTWQRAEQLELSIHHYLSCRSVAQVQVVWCIDQGSVPEWLSDWEQRSNHTVVVERHVVNSLNARFNLSTATTTTGGPATPTKGILSTDDDVLRPCLALEAAFVVWTRNPDRQVGFDARSHGVVLATTAATTDTTAQSQRWTYAYMSTTERTNMYSLTLTRHSFQHVDYLHSYTNDMPSVIREFVSTHLNCEDVAMSFWISSLTHGQPPLLADAWAVKSQIKLYVQHKISGGASHKTIRDECVDLFATLLHLKQRLNATRLRHGGGSGVEPYFAYGSSPSNWNADAVTKVHAVTHNEWYGDMQNTLNRWKRNNNVWMSELADLRRVAAKRSFDRGLIESTSLWKKRFKGTIATS